MKKFVIFAVLFAVMMAMGVSAYRITDTHTLNESMVVLHDTFTREVREANYSFIGSPDIGSDWWLDFYGGGWNEYYQQYVTGGTYVNNATAGWSANVINGYNGISIADSPNKINFEFDYKDVNPSNNSEVNLIEINYGSGGAYLLFYMRMEGNGSMACTDFNTWSDPTTFVYNDGEWHHFKLVADGTTFLVTATMDDQLICEMTGSFTENVISAHGDTIMLDWMMQGHNDATERIQLIDDVVGYYGNVSPYYIPQAPFNTSNYAHHQAINCTNVTTGAPMRLDFTLNSSEQVVWTICDLSDLTLHWNSNDDWAIADGLDNLWYWETEKGDVASNNPTDVWTDYVAVYHLGNTADSTANNYDLTPEGTPTFVSGAFADSFQTSTMGDVAYSQTSDPDLCAQYSYEVWLDPSGTYNSGGDNWAMAHWWDGGCGSQGIQLNMDNLSLFWNMNCRQTGYVSLTGDMQYQSINYDGTQFNIFLDGVFQFSSVQPRYHPDFGEATSGTFYVSRGDSNDNGAFGKFDEIRFSCNAKSDIYFDEVYENFLGTAGYGTLMDEESPCIPDWICTGYASCLENDTQMCNAVTDLNTCGEEYTGDYTEFEPQACDFCTPDWNCSSFGDCDGETRLCLAVEDLNTCGEEFEGLLSEYDEECEVEPPITGYVSQYDSGDLRDMTIDFLGTTGAEVVQWIGFIVLMGVAGVAVVRFTKIRKLGR